MIKIDPSLLKKVKFVNYTFIRVYDNIYGQFKE